MDNSDKSTVLITVDRVIFYNNKHTVVLFSPTSCQHLMCLNMSSNWTNFTKFPDHKTENWTVSRKNYKDKAMM